MDAIRSVKIQTLSKDQYEIIVVKNFFDSEIDSELDKLGGKMIIKGNENIGVYLTSAIESCKGEIIVFLDDDDQFVRDRLQIIFDLFENNDKIGYFHNDKIPIDSDGKELKDSLIFRRQETENMQRLGSFLVTRPITESDLRRLYQTSASSYMSSLAIRRSILVLYLKFLESIESAQDYFMFCAALLSNYDLAMYSSKLTKYRLHQGNVSNFTFKSKAVSSFQDSYRTHLAREISSLKVILQMIDLDGTKKNKIVKKLILHEISKRRFSYNMLDSKISRGTFLIGSFTFLKYQFPASFSSQSVRFIRSLIFLIFPNYERRLFITERSETNQ